MNEQFTLQDLELLIAHTGKPSISLYMPTFRIPTRIQAESLQFKNLLHDAEAQLEQYDLSGPQIRAILEPARELIKNSDFWRHQQDGLALFLAEETFLRYQVPTSFSTDLIVAEAFHLKPLIPLLTNDFVFYILAVSQNRVRFLRCTRFSAEEINPANTPNSLQEILNEYEIEKEVQYHTSTATPGTGRRGAIFHGQGAGESTDEKAKILEYFQRIDRGLRDYLQDQQAPLVFAGVEYLFPIYREANTYTNLVESNITGNPDQIHNNDLHRDAWKLMEPSFAAQRTADIERYYSSAPHGLTSTDVEELLPWADKGRIDTAFVDKQAFVWGVYNQAQFKAEAQKERTPHTRDLTDMIALYTLTRSGKVYLLTPEEMEMEFGPDNRHRSNNGTPQNAAQNISERPAVAAIYRYTI